jgi:hypothetical protein
MSTALLFVLAAVGCGTHQAPTVAPSKADDASQCAFGATLSALRASPAFMLGSPETVTQATVTTIEPYLFDRAFGQGTGDTNLDTIFAALDGNQLQRQSLADLVDSRSYMLYTFSVSGLAAGFIAIAGSTAVVAKVRADAITDCDVAPLAACDDMTPCPSAYSCRPSPIDASQSLCFSCARIALTEVCPAGQSYSVKDCACKDDALDCTQTGMCPPAYTCIPNVLTTGKSCISCARLALTATCSGGEHFDVAACSCVPN